jgi:hypothetical protein
LFAVSNARKGDLASGENQKSTPEANFSFNSPPLAYLLSSRSTLDNNQSPRVIDIR